MNNWQRSLDLGKQIYLSVVKSHHLVTSRSIARWLHEVLKNSGTDVNIFSAQSVQGAFGSAAEITTNDTQKPTECSSESVFRNSITDIFMTLCAWACSVVIVPNIRGKVVIN